MRGVIGLVIAIVMIVGGLTGTLTLRGTHSGTGLAAVGGVLAVVNLLRIVQARA